MKRITMSLTLLALTVPAFAEEAAAQQQSPLASFVPLIIIFFIFYFMLIRPQSKRQKEHQKMLNALKKDDKVITSGGLYGVVTNVKGEVIEVKIAENVKVQVAKSAISTIVQPEAAAAAEQPKPTTPDIIK